MSICKARLRKLFQCANASNVRLTAACSDPDQIVRSQQLDRADDQAVNSRMLVRVPKVLRSGARFSKNLTTNLRKT